MKNLLLAVWLTFLFINPSHAETQKVFYPNGKLFQEIDYIDGKDWKIYDSNGVLMQRKKYDLQGNLVEERFYDSQGNIIQNGDWKGHNIHGQVSRTITLKDGKIDGEDLRYDEQGKVNWKRVYKDGNLVLEQTFDKDGNLKYSK